ncbi:SDR family oxidoreductase [Desulforhopalus sp. IMCC35007]|uniref:UDP-glucose 4-epimerase family protein n=1 Tax=Desulforhopalus sp. IMCC35007 TaxID=2569543 RepID=UPI0010ADD57F|nr:SDR family oxidoreductase [Desulforhopalus sp. IMCC35007]TKB09919.1 SDR family oxidoreductase [Desulforhopalus sp. IMCC35007]
MRRILVTGANGFVGRWLTKKLLQRNYFVRNAVRRQALADISSDEEIIIIDNIDHTTKWERALACVDCVVHLAARVHVMNEKSEDQLSNYHTINVNGTVNLAKQAAECGVRRFVYISSIKVNGENTIAGLKFVPDDDPCPVGAYAVSKYETELALLAISSKTSMEVVIIRPPLVYGPGVKANFKNLMNWLDKGIPLPFGSIYNKRSFVYVENLVDLIIVCIDHPKAKNEIFLAGDGASISTTELLVILGQALERPARLVRVPHGLLEIAAALLGKRSLAHRILGSLQVDISKTVDLLDWAPAYTLNEGLWKTAKAYIRDKAGYEAGF